MCDISKEESKTERPALAHAVPADMRAHAVGTRFQQVFEYGWLHGIAVFLLHLVLITTATLSNI